MNPLTYLQQKNEAFERLMDMFEKLKFWMVGIVAAFLLIYILPLQSMINGAIYTFYSKSELNINLSLVNPTVTLLAAEPSNRLALQVEVKNASGSPVPKALVIFSTDKNMGGVYPSKVKTDKYGQCIVTYIPPLYKDVNMKKDGREITITAAIDGTNTSSSIKIGLAQVPVVYIHGYLASGSIFDNLREYLESKGYEGSAITFDSAKGVISGASELKAFLKQEKLKYLSKGMQVKKFNIVAHSMGGLVVRYYTSTPDYFNNDDVEKIIFISVPHKGSPWASIGEGYFNNQGIVDLSPESSLIAKTLPSMRNNGLNSKIQVGNLLAQYDEVVSPESARLDEWNIKTQMFNIGENHFTMDSLLSGSIIEASNHKSILNNKKVFEKVEDMLNQQLPYPSTKK